MNYMQKNAPVVKGSIGDVAKDTGKSLAETFVNAEAVLIVDTSGSMNSQDSRGGDSRYNVAVAELEDLQASIPGKVAVLSFSGDVVFCPGGVPIYLGGGTDLARALSFARVADVPGIRFVVISDGYPDAPDKALAVARSYSNRIDTIYVGPENRSDGRKFLNELSRASGGVHVDDFRVGQLADHARLLIGSTA